MLPPRSEIQALEDDILKEVCTANLPQLLMVMPGKRSGFGLAGT